MASMPNPKPGCRRHGGVECVTWGRRPTSVRIVWHFHVWHFQTCGAYYSMALGPTLLSIAESLRRSHHAMRRSVYLLLLLCGGVQTLSAQQRVLIAEHRFGADSDAITLPLRRGIVYNAELTGQGTLVIELMQKQPRAAFLVPIGDTTLETRRFEFYALQDGVHSVRVTGVPPGDSALLRLYSDTVETERIARKLDRGARIGFSFAGGFHSGYRLDPTGGVDPSGGSDFEACLLLEIGDRAGTCLGFA